MPHRPVTPVLAAPVLAAPVLASPVLAAVAALALLTAALTPAPALAQQGDPNTMKCVEFVNLSAEGMGQIARALEEQLTGKNELNPDLVRHLGNVCPMNPELTVAEAAAKK